MRDPKAPTTRSTQWKVAHQSCPPNILPVYPRWKAINKSKSKTAQPGYGWAKKKKKKNYKSREKRKILNAWKEDFRGGTHTHGPQKSAWHSQNCLKGVRQKGSEMWRECTKNNLNINVKNKNRKFEKDYRNVQKKIACSHVIFILKMQLNIENVCNTFVCQWSIFPECAKSGKRDPPHTHMHDKAE